MFDTGSQNEAQSEFYKPFMKIFYLNFDESKINSGFEDLFDRCTSHITDHTILLKTPEITQWCKLISAALAQAKIVVEEISLGNVFLFFSL